MQSVSVIGLGKAGLPLAAVIAESGTEVIGIDTDQKRVDMINSGQNPITEESGLSELIEKHTKTNLKATTSYEEGISRANCHIVIVPLFLNDGHAPDFSLIDNAFESIAKHLKKDDLVVLETTVPVGTTRGRVKDALENGSGLKAGQDFSLAYSPERIATGKALENYRNFPKLIGGIDKTSTEKAYNLYNTFSKPEKVSSPEVAELAKIAEGVYRDTNIAIANELYKISQKYNLDFWEMRKAAEHRYCNILEPGIAGGHCIPVYPWFIIHGYKSPLLLASREINDGMADFLVHKVKEKLSGKKGKVAVVGLTYRAGVKESFHSPSLTLIQKLKQIGYEVFGSDPLFTNEEISIQFQVPSTESFSEMDVIVLMNKEPSYKEKLQPVKEKVIDLKNVLA